jgi:hypothetical protein
VGIDNGSPTRDWSSPLADGALVDDGRCAPVEALAYATQVHVAANRFRWSPEKSACRGRGPCASVWRMAPRTRTTKQPTPSPATADLRPVFVELETSNLSKSARFALDLHYGEDVDVSWRHTTPKVGQRGVARVKVSSLERPSSLLFFFTGRASAKGKYLKSAWVTDPAPMPSRCDGALLPFLRAPAWAGPGPVKLKLGFDDAVLKRTRDLHDVRLSFNGKRMKVPCVCWTGKASQDLLVCVAKEGPLEGLVLLARTSGNAMRVTSLRTT